MLQSRTLWSARHLTDGTVTLRVTHEWAFPVNMSSQPFHGSPLKTSNKSQNIRSQPLLKTTKGVLRRGNPTNRWRTTEITEENRRNKLLLVITGSRHCWCWLRCSQPWPSDSHLFVRLLTSPRQWEPKGHLRPWPPMSVGEEGARVSRLDGHVQTRSQFGGRSLTVSRKTGGESAFSVRSGGSVSPGVTQKYYYVSWHVILRIKYKNGPFHTKGASYKEGNRFTNRIKRRNIPRRKFCFHHLLTSSKQSNQNQKEY